jgi:GNAT superfamily N-acetyltransferase
MFTMRPATHLDEAFLFEMLYEALFVPPGQKPFPSSILEAREIAHYVEGFGVPLGDTGFVAEAEETPIGASWVRLLQGDNRGYGYVDDDTPELTIAVRPKWRGRGVGTALATRLIEVVPRISLSSDPRNPAIRLYRRLGFKPVAHHGTLITMLRPR